MLSGLKGDADVVLAVAPAAGSLLWNGLCVGLAQDAIGGCDISQGSRGHHSKPGHKRPLKRRGLSDASGVS